MQQPTPMSLRNRTGMQRSPVDAGEMLSAPDDLAPSAYLDGSSAASMRGLYIADAEALGSIPPPGTAKGMAKAGLQALAGRRMQAVMRESRTLDAMAMPGTH